MRRYILWGIFISYVLIGLKIILFKYSLDTMHIMFVGSLDERISLSNFVPFSTIAGYATGNPTWQIALENIFGNILIFLPLGVLLPLLRKSFYSLWRIVLLTFLISLSLECVQLFFAIGSFDVDDVILNTLGALIGYVCLRLWLIVIAALQSTSNQA